MTLAWLPCDRHSPVINDAVPAAAYGLPAGVAFGDMIMTSPLRLALSAWLDDCPGCLRTHVDAMTTRPEQVVYAVITSALTAQADTGRSVLDQYRARIHIPAQYLAVEAMARLDREHLDAYVATMSPIGRSHTIHASLAILAAALHEGKPVRWYPPVA